MKSTNCIDTKKGLKKDLTPEGEDIGLDGATRGAKVVKASNASVDLEGGYVK